MTGLVKFSPWGATPYGAPAFNIHLHLLPSSTVPFNSLNKVATNNQLKFNIQCGGHITHHNAGLKASYTCCQCFKTRNVLILISSIVVLFIYLMFCLFIHYALFMPLWNMYNCTISVLHIRICTFKHTHMVTHIRATRNYNIPTAM